VLAFKGAVEAQLRDLWVSHEPGKSSRSMEGPPGAVNKEMECIHGGSPCSSRGSPWSSGAVEAQF